jgi:hypothetical protein
MSKDFMKKVSIKLIQIKKEKVIFQYLIFIGISILLGLFLKYEYDRFISLIEPSLDSLHILGMSSINNSNLFITSVTMLSTVVTLIFAILIFFTQVSYEYTLTDIFMKKETLILIISYFVTIILSLIMLETTFQFPILVLTMTIGCILLLFPFLYFLNRMLVFEIGVTRLNIDIMALIESRNRSQILIKLNSLKNISELCIKKDRLDYFSNILFHYTEFLENAQKKKMENAIDIIGFNYIEILLYSIKKSKTKNRKIIVMSLFRQINTYITKYSEIIKCTNLELQIFF